jgi:hypothetical protein
MKRPKTLAQLRDAAQAPLDLPIQPPPSPLLVPYLMTHYLGLDNMWHEMGYEHVMWLHVNDVARPNERGLENKLYASEFKSERKAA